VHHARALAYCCVRATSETIFGYLSGAGRAEASVVNGGSRAENIQAPAGKCWKQWACEPDRVFTCLAIIALALTGVLTVVT
jgi:hypothetical protein